MSLKEEKPKKKEVPAKKEKPTAEKTQAKPKKNTWKSRVEDERKQLNERIEKLDVALNTKKVPKSEEDVLRRQVHAMRKYRQILDERLA